MNILLNDTEYDAEDLINTDVTSTEAETTQHFIGKPMNFLGKQVDSYVVICDTITLLIFGLMIRYFIKELMDRILTLRYEIMLRQDRKAERAKMKEEIKYAQSLVKIEKEKTKQEKKSRT